MYVYVFINTPTNVRNSCRTIATGTAKRKKKTHTYAEGLFALQLHHGIHGMRYREMYINQ